MSNAEVATKAISNLPVQAQIAIYLAAAGGFTLMGAAVYNAVQNGCSVEYEHADGRKVSFSTSGRKKQTIVKDVEASVCEEASTENNHQEDSQ